MFSLAGSRLPSTCRASIRQFSRAAAGSTLVRSSSPLCISSPSSLLSSSGVRSRSPLISYRRSPFSTASSSASSSGGGASSPPSPRSLLFPVVALTAGGLLFLAGESESDSSFSFLPTASAFPWDRKEKTDQVAPVPPPTPVALGTGTGTPDADSHDLHPVQSSHVSPPPSAVFLHPSAQPIASNSLEYLHLPTEVATLTTAPEVPPAITRHHPVLLKVDLTTTTKVTQLTNQFKYEQWTFNDSVPGPFIRARVGDVVELSLTNLDKTGNPHNIDCHGFEGPGGGAALTTAAENQTKKARFKLLYPGLYVYHCAAAPVPVHIANGMYGLMYVQAEYDTLPPVDKEFYVMQSEFYHEPPEVLENGRQSNTVEHSYPRGLSEDADVVCFNGSQSALTREKPLKAQTGDNIRIFFGNAGPNLTSSFHVIGGIFEKVYRDGDIVSAPGRFIQTVSVPPGGSSVLDMKMLVPGTYTLVDHAIFRLDKGGVGYLNCSGPPRPDIYQSAAPPEPCVGCKLHP